MPETTIIALANAMSTLFMAGVIWFVQVVHYPLFALVGTTDFGRYEREHAGRTTWVVAPPMLIEAFTATLLLWLRPAGIGLGMAATGAVLVGVIWASTFALQVPMHAKLSAGFEPEAHRNLVATNWVRTAAWTARAGLAVAMIAAMTGSA